MGRRKKNGIRELKKKLNQSRKKAKIKKTVGRNTERQDKQKAQSKMIETT